VSLKALKAHVALKTENMSLKALKAHIALKTENITMLSTGPTKPTRLWRSKL
jgi:hypothetical protein